MAVVVENYQFDLLAFGQVEKLPGAGAELLLVVVSGPGFAIDGEGALHHHGVDGEEDRAGLGQLDENGLMAGSVTACFEESDARREFRVAIDKAITERGMIPMRAGRCKTRVAVAGQRVMFALHD